MEHAAGGGASRKPRIPLVDKVSLCAAVLVPSVDFVIDMGFGPPWLTCRSRFLILADRAALLLVLLL